MKITIKKAQESDIEFIAALEAKTFSLPQSHADLKDMSLTPGKLLLVAFADGKHAGYVGAYTVCRETDIMTVAVDESFRNNGIGRALVTALFSEFCGVSDAVFLEVRESNTTARKLYKSLGFCETGKRKGYYKLPTEDAILYKKDL